MTAPTADGHASATATAAAALGVASRDGRVLKAHGTGNDFVVVVDPDDELVLTPDLVVALCDRHHGIGADGVIRVGAAPPPDVRGRLRAAVVGAPVFMDYRNGDGTIVEMCGNGVRVVAKVVHDLDLVDATAGAPLVVGTRAGLRPVRVVVGDDGRVATVTVDMGPPRQDAQAVGLATSGVRGDVTGFSLPDTPGVPADTTFAGMSMGNPHAVTVVADVDAVPLARMGPVVETHTAFAHGVNVNVVEVVDRATLRLRVWERGVGETQACGTGACATVAAMAVAGRVDPDEPVTVHVRGGTLSVARDDRGHLQMSGPAEVVATLDLDAAWLARRSTG